ncbi:MAG: hypothetical protein L0H74_03685 [Brachybacterium sp.]|nr:hypothetical protein [Brachybacterium sp.]MDN5899148.1 hypothetical protein [Brachybacterium sp.]
MVTQATPEPVRVSARTLLLNNLVAALIASALMIFLHETAHLVAGLAFGHPSVLFPFGVDHLGSPSDSDQVVMLLAGPAFSLVTGVLLQLWTPLRRRADLLHLVWLWFAFASVQEGIAYLCLTPFGAGDTGEAARLLGLPVPLQLVALAVGIGGMFLNARAFAPHMARHAGDDPRRRNAMTLFPWLYGMIVSVLLSVLYLAISPADLPVSAQIAILAAGTAILVFAPMAHIFARSVAEVPYEPLRLRTVPLGGLVALAVLVLGNILLSLGVHVG